MNSRHDGSIRCESFRFNPHSPLLANELIGESDPNGKGLHVSIHIRHCWRMNSDPVRVAVDADAVSIHIRHCWRMN